MDKVFGRFCGVLALLVSHYSIAQPGMDRCDTVKIFKGASAIKNPWAGGLNFTEWSKIDFDLDGQKDLAVFDKSGNKIRAFLNDGVSGQPNYTHAPQLEDKFPLDIDSWVLFFDFNCDGKEDLYTYSAGFGGVRVFRNTSTPGNLSFVLEKKLVYSNYNPLGAPAWINLYCNSVALPGITDIDNDGDLDILSFSAVGVKIEYHKNMSKELYGNCDSLVFHMVDDCWGDVQESTCASQLSVCPYPRAYLDAIGDISPMRNIQHAGSCINCFDADGDLDIDVVLGDISCDSIEFFVNGGSTSNAHITSATKQYPVASPIAQKTFPCTYFLDIDNDGKRDLIATPNATSASENYTGVNYYNNSNTDASPIFNFVQNNFLQEQMIDVGEGSYPAVFDLEGDGDKDILIGNFGYYVYPSYISKLALLKNIGSVSNPIFKLDTLDYQNLSTTNITNMVPTFGDLDNDGDDDLIVGGYDGRLTYFVNAASAGNPANFVYTADFGSGCVAGLDVGQIAYPTLVDVNRDGKIDIVCGEQNGTLTYFQNTGTVSAPNFTLIQTNFGGVNVSEVGWIVGQSVPTFIDESGNYKMVVGSERGYLFLYGNIDGNLGGNFSLIDSIAFNDFDPGQRSSAAFADFTNDGILDMLVGNYSGGLSFFKGNNSVGLDEISNYQSNVILYPNPSSEEINLKFDSDDLRSKKINIVDATGRSVIQEVTRDNKLIVNVENLASGIYFVQISSDGGRDNKLSYTVIKFVKH